MGCSKAILPNGPTIWIGNSLTMFQRDELLGLLAKLRNSLCQKQHLRVNTNTVASVSDLHRLFLAKLL